MNQADEKLVIEGGKLKFLTQDRQIAAKDQGGVVVDYPAACIQTKKGCECYSQQGTKLLTPVDLCRQIVVGGFFMDWKAKEAPTGHAGGFPAPQPGQGPAVLPVASPAPPAARSPAPAAAASMAWNFTGLPEPAQYASNDAQDVEALTFMRNRRR